MQFIQLKHTIQWLLVYLQSCAFIVTISRRLYYSKQKSPNLWAHLKIGVLSIFCLGHYQIHDFQIFSPILWVDFSFSSWYHCSTNFSNFDLVRFIYFLLLIVLRCQLVFKFLQSFSLVSFRNWYQVSHKQNEINRGK